MSRKKSEAEREYATQRKRVMRLIDTLRMQILAADDAMARAPDHFTHGGSMALIAQFLAEATGETK